MYCNVWLSKIFFKKLKEHKSDIIFNNNLITTLAKLYGDNKIKSIDFNSTRIFSCLYSPYKALIKESVEIFDRVISVITYHLSFLLFDLIYWNMFNPSPSSSFQFSNWFILFLWTFSLSVSACGTASKLFLPWFSLLSLFLFHIFFHFHWVEMWAFLYQIGFVQSNVTLRSHNL